jgi:hypothetical protein
MLACIYGVYQYIGGIAGDGYEWVFIPILLIIGPLAVGWVLSIIQYWRGSDT